MKMKQRYPGLVPAILLVLFVTVPSLLAQDGGKSTASALFQAFTLPKLWISWAFGLAGLVLLVRSLVTKKVRAAAQALALITFGVLASLPLGPFVQQLGLHPSPMCMIEKPFIFVSMGRAIPMFFFSMILAVTVLNLVGNKLFCGWVCPLGAFQELLNMLAPAKKIKVPFTISNTVRILLFAAFLIVLFAAGTSIYPFVNGFEFFHFGWELIGIIIIALIAAAALFIYRPFCYFICPMGLFSWLTEHIALFRVYKNEKPDCGKCRICVEKSPCPAVQSIVDGKWSRPDCHACGACIDVCPNHKLTFSIRKK
ncbi:4Fe-4S binding protein [bacterium]|nr:4Fe-4S binding protein [bacterium]